MLKKYPMFMLIVAVLLFHHHALSEGSQDQHFIVLGDMHYDLLEYHDLEWLLKEYPGDYNQVTKSYAVFTKAYFQSFINELLWLTNYSAPPTYGIVQLGDLQEGLAGSDALAQQMAMHSIAALRSSEFDVPWILVKGNHDVTGPGASEAYARVVLPFIESELHMPVSTSQYSYRAGDVQFIVIDCFDESNIISFVENELSKSTAKYNLICTHKPFIPVTARCWVVFEGADEQGKREQLLNTIAKYKAIVLCGHLHEYSVVRRMTESGPVVQIMANSVIRKSPLDDPYWYITKYGPSLLSLEPDFSPSTESSRRKLLSDEAPHVSDFRLADMPGYLTLTFHQDERKISLKAYKGLGRNLHEEVILEEHALSIQTDGMGSVRTDPDHTTFFEGKPVELTAHPALGWIFDRWSGDLSGNSNPAHLVMDTVKSVTAHFIPVPNGQLELRVSPIGSGTAHLDPPGPYYDSGTSVHVTVVPDSGWTFDHWEGALKGFHSNPLVMMTGHAEIIPVFREIHNYPIRLHILGSGSVHRDPPGSLYPENTVVSLTAVPSSGSEFLYWQLDTMHVNRTLSITMESPKEVLAVFRSNGQQVIRLTPSNDTYVRGGLYSSKNFNQDDYLRIQSETSDMYKCKTVLQYDLSRLEGTVAGALLELRVKQTTFSKETAATFDLYNISDDSWTESTITWKNAPAPTTLIEEQSQYLSDHACTFWDLTSIIQTEKQGDSKASFLITDPTVSGKTVDFYARETDHPPVLILITHGSNSVSSNTSNQPSQFKLYPNYPNPFNPITHIQYDLPHDAAVRLSIMDIQGREIAVLVNEKQTQGEYRVSWQAGDADKRSLSGGLYFLKLKAGNFIATRKMIVLK